MSPRRGFLWRTGSESTFDELFVRQVLGFFHSQSWLGSVLFGSYLMRNVEWVFRRCLYSCSEMKFMLGIRGFNDELHRIVLVCWRLDVNADDAHVVSIELEMLLCIVLVKNASSKRGSFDGDQRLLVRQNCVTQ